MFNYDFITERLAVGSAPEERADLTRLLDDGVTNIIDCRTEANDYKLLESMHAHLNYLQLGTDDWIPFSKQRKPISWFQIGVGYALPLLALPGARILVHCHAGANRSATMAWAILRAFGLTEDECFDAIDRHRLIAMVGLRECGWYIDANNALKELRYI